MQHPTPETDKTQKMAQDLCAFAIDRTDLKELLSRIPENHNLNLTMVEYELSILKILSAGWAISFYMPVTDPDKQGLSHAFWTGIQEISGQISTLAESTTGQTINYFDIIKQRLDTYVEVMQANTETASDPTAVMGPAFADACQSPDDAVAILIGTKMFTLTMGAVKEYLDTMRNDTPPTTH